MLRLVAYLLIPLFVLGQVLPHSHAGVEATDARGHGHQPHLHLHANHHHGDEHGPHGGHSHHEAEHEETTAGDCLSVPHDHDSDAVYLAETDWTARRMAKADVASVSLWHCVCSDMRSSRPLNRIATHPPDRDSGLPVYLLTASLRL